MLAWVLGTLLSLQNDKLVRELAMQEHYERALIVSAICKKTPEVYFWKAVCEFKLNHKPQAVAILKHVLTPLTPHNPPLPERYIVLAVMMQDELKERWTDADLDNTARKMDNVQRRLSKGLAKNETIKLQKEIMDDLDKRIKDLEDQIAKSNQSSSGGQSQQPQIPVGDSKIMQGTGNGDVSQKKLVITSEVWGKMPAKEKVKVLEAVNRQLPAHIREAAEGFSKKLQTGGK